MANMAFRAADAHSRWLGGVFESTLRMKRAMHRWHLAFGSIESTVETSPAHRSPTTSRTPSRPRSITADANGAPFNFGTLSPSLPALAVRLRS